MNPYGQRMKISYSLNRRPSQSVESAGLIQMLPVQESGWTENIALQGIAPVSQTPQAEYRIVSPGYFNVFHIRLQAGRLLQQEIDRPETQPAAVVNAAFVRKFVPPGTNPIGLKVQDEQDSTIDGVTSDVRQDLFTDAKPEIDYVMSQIPPQETLRVIKKLHLLIGTTAELPDLSREISLALREIDPTLPDRPVITMETVINSAVGSQRTQQWIFISFAMAALILGGVGIYVLFAQEIEEEKRQLAIRIALGAPRAHILAHLMFQILRIALSGIVVGAVIAVIALANVPDAIAYTRSAEAASFCVVIGIVAVTSVCAGLAPAIRMMLSDPLEILKV